MSTAFKEYYKIRKSDIGDKNFNELVQFAKEFVADDEADDILKFIQIGYDGNEFVQTKNYVGLIQLPSGFQIEILPKIDGNGDIRDVFLKMLRSLPKFTGKKLSKANLNTSKMTLYEVFINMYFNDVLTLVKRGLRASYITRKDNLKFFKGKLLVNQHLHHNLVHHERFYVEYDEYSLDQPEHRLIKAAILKLQRKTNSLDNSQLAYQLLAHFDFTEPSSNYDKDFAAFHVDRRNKNYSEVMEWTKIFLKDESFTSFAGKTKAQALLFPMEKLFESYVAKQVNKIFSKNDWEVTIQSHEKYLFDSPKSFQLKPDIILRKNNRKIILDTKWKYLKTFKNISAGDMYQMYAYAKKHISEEVYLLYPVTKDIGTGKAYKADDKFNVHIFFIDLFHMNDSMMRLLSDIDNGS